MTAYDDAVSALGSDIVRYWPLDDASGSTADDRKNAADGAYVGTVLYGQGGILREQNGVETVAGSSGYVTLPVSGLTGAGTIFGWYHLTAGGNGYFFRDNSTGIWYNPFAPEWRFAGATQSITGAPERQLSSGRKFVAITLSGSQADFYLDGVHVQTFTTTATLSSLSSPLYLGRNGPNAQYTTSRVAGWGVANRVLTSTEIEDLYEAGRRPQVTLRDTGTQGSGASTSLTLSSPQMPTHAAGDRLLIVVVGKPDTDAPTPTINQGWTFIKKVTGGTGSQAADTGALAAWVFAKDAASGSETAPTITWGTTASVRIHQAFAYTLEAGETWADAIASNAGWVQSASDTDTASPLTGTTGAFTDAPTEGDTILIVGGVPTDSGTSTGLTHSASVSGLSALPESVYEFVDSGTGNDIGHMAAHLYGYSGTASAGVEATFTIPSATDSSGVIVAVALRGSSPVGTVVLGGSAPAPVADFDIIRPASTIAGGGVAPSPVAAFALTAVTATLALGGVAPVPVASFQILDDSVDLVTSAGVAPAPVAAFSLDRTVSAVTGAGVAPAPVAAFTLTRPASSVTLGGVAPAAVGVFDLAAVVDDGFTCLDLDTDVIEVNTGSIVGGEIVPPAGLGADFLLATPELEADKTYELRLTFEGGTYADADAYVWIAGTDTDYSDYGVLFEAEQAFDTAHVFTIGSGIGDWDAAVAGGLTLLNILGPVDSTITAVCWRDVTAAEIVEPEPVEDDQELVEVPTVDQGDHEAEWHDYPAVGALAVSGARDVAFVLDVDGNAHYASKPRLRDRIFAKNGDGAWDITVVNGKRTQMADYQLMKPFTYGVGTLSVPGLNPILDDLSAYPWLAPWTKVFVQRVNDDDEIVSTDYRSRIISIDLSGADVTLDLGGMFTGPAAVQWRPKPLVRRRENPVYWLHAMFRKNRMPLDTVDLGFEDVTSPPQGWHLNCALDVVAGAVKRNGDALTVTYDEDVAKFVASLVDRETIHATVYLDHGYMRPDLTRDFSAEKNQVYAAGTDENGGKILFAVAPGMEQVVPVPDYPLVSGDPFGEGTVDADTTDGAGISRLILRLITLGYLRRDDKSDGFDAEVGRAVTDARIDAKLDDYGLGDPTLEQVDEDLWAWLWDADATGLTMKEARIRPAYEVPELGKYNFTATGKLKGVNASYDPSLIPVSEVVDFTTSMRKGQMKKRARRYVFDGPNWTGTISASVTGVIAGEHNPGDPFTADDVISTRDVREGWNLWVPNFEGGTLFHVSGVDVSDDGFNVRMMVDTQARDALTINEILDRQEQNRLSPSKAFFKQASGNYGKDTITGYLGEIGGKIGTDVFCPAGQWTVLPIPLGDYGMVQQIRTRLRSYVDDAVVDFDGSSPNADPAVGVRHAVMVFGKDVRSNNDTRESAFLDARRPDPFAAGDFADTKAADDDFDDRGVLAAWGGQNQDGSFEFCGFGKWGDDGEDPSGNFFEDSGFPFRAPECVAYVCIFAETDAMFLSGRVLWWQLDEGT